MGMGTVVVAAIVFVVLFFALFFHYAAEFRTDTQTYTHGDALKSLITDINQAQRRILVVCERCDLDDASDPEKLEFVNAAKSAHAKGVSLVLVIHAQPPEILKQLGKDGIIEIKPAKLPVPYVGRVIDRRKVVRYLGTDPQMYPAGEYISAEDATDIASDLENLALAA